MKQDETLIREVVTKVVAQLVKDNKITTDQIEAMTAQVYGALMAEAETKENSGDGSFGRQLSAATLPVRGPKPDYSGTPQAVKGSDPKEVVIGVGAAFQTDITKTITGIDLSEVIATMKAGIEEEGMIPRVVKILDTSDVGFMGLEAAKLSGSGIGIGLQSKGTAVIHQKDLYPLSNLELFPQAPLMTLALYRQIGQNAAKYVKGERVTPVKIINDPMARPSYQVKAALMHIRETQALDSHVRYIEWK